MEVYGLIGFPLSHSFSKKHFTDKFFYEKLDCIYENFEIDNLEKLASIISQTENLKGINVTIPYKEKIIPFMDEMDETALAIGAVNTIKIIEANGIKKLKGFNTDVYGFEKSLLPLIKNRTVSALILGNGGASKAVAFVLKKLNIEYKIVSRNPTTNQLQYTDLNETNFSSYQLIINTTPVGTLDDLTILPLPYAAFTAKHICYDLVYNPSETNFLKIAKANGATIKNGTEMLQLQADKAWEIWQTSG